MESGPASLRISKLALFTLTVLLVAPALHASVPPNIDGIWEGAIEAGQDKTPLTIHISSKNPGGISVVMDAPNSNAWAIPAIIARLDGTRLTFGIDANRRFEGNLDLAGKKITGKWIQNGSWPNKLTYRGPEPQSTASALDGDWIGLLRNPLYRTLRIALHIKANSDKAQAWFYSLDQDGIPYSCAGTKLSGAKFTFQLPSLHANYEGNVSKGGEVIVGTWNQWRPLKLDFLRVKSAATQMADDRKRSAKAPIRLSQLGVILDKEFAPAVADGLLSKATGGGVVIGVLDHGQRRIFSYGAAKPDSIFEIASVTKTFTGLALAQMVEQKKVTLDEPLRELLPAGTAKKPSGPEITLADLATHHSGLPRLAPNLSSAEVNSFAEYNNDKLREFFNKNGIAAPVEPKFEYSNFGFSLLGYALSLRAGTSYDDLIRSQVAHPLQLIDTEVNLSEKQNSRMIGAYDSAFDRYQPGAYDSTMFAGAAGIKSTAPDLLTYLEANLHPDRVGRGAKPGTPAATLSEALKFQHKLRADTWPGGRIGLAWNFDTKRKTYFHMGGALGYSSIVQFDPARDRAIVVLYNRLDDTPGRDRFVDRIASNIDELMNGQPATRIDYLPEHERAVIALALFTDHAIDGTYHCRVNAFALPASSKDPYSPTGTGEMQLIADGTGTFTRGTWQHHIRAPGLKLDCDLKLKSGTYSVRPDGTGSDETRWELQPGKYQDQCSQFFPAFRQATATNPQLIVPDRDSGTFYVSAISDIATLGVVCER